MTGKNADDEAKSWFWRDAKGTKSGPADLKRVRDMVLAGEVTAQTPVSLDGSVWRSAVSFPDFGFDCIVLDVGESLNVLGPFAKEYVDRLKDMSEVPSDGILFVRGGTVKEALPGNVPGATGAALVERVIAAEKSLKESEKARRAAEASLAAKDLEFDAERQKLNGSMSGLKASELKLRSEIEALRSELERGDASERRQHELEARLVDAENLLSAARTAAEKAASDSDGRTKALDAAVKKTAELEAALAEANGKLNGVDQKYVDLERRLAEAGKTINEREARCLDLEGRLSESLDSLAEIQGKSADDEAHIAELSRSMKGYEANARVFRDSASWLRGKLTDLAGEVAERFYSPEEATVSELPSEPAAQDAASSTAPAIEAVEPEVLSDARENSGTPVKVRKVAVAGSQPHDMAKLSALESQLQREISSLGAAKGGGGRDGIIGVFKRRK